MKSNSSSWGETYHMENGSPQVTKFNCRASDTEIRFDSLHSLQLMQDNPPQTKNNENPHLSISAPERAQGRLITNARSQGTPLWPSLVVYWKEYHSSQRKKLSWSAQINTQKWPPPGDHWACRGKGLCCPENEARMIKTNSDQPVTVFRVLPNQDFWFPGRVSQVNMGKTGSKTSVNNPGDTLNFIWNETLEKDQYAY